MGEVNKIKTTEKDGEKEYLRIKFNDIFRNPAVFLEKKVEVGDEIKDNKAEIEKKAGDEITDFFKTNPYF